MKNLLTESMAISRSLIVKPKIFYEIFLDLNKGKSYNGFGSYRFDILKKDDIFLDFAGKSFENCYLNKCKIIPEIKEGKIFINKNCLEIGQNILEFDFHNDYYTDGNGIHSFIEEDNQFIYCQSEPYWGNRIFPMFDQPDLKGTYKLITKSPSDWIVLANTNERNYLKLDSNKAITNDFIKLFDVTEMFKEKLKKYFDLKAEFHNEDLREFETTQLLSTYLYCFVAGPFKCIQNKKDTKVPIRIFCRKAIYNYAVEQADIIFSYASGSIDFFSKKFDYPYPFGKCDLVFCPEFTVGAMENPGLITFNDLYIFREIPTSLQISRRGETIAHEVAHMWFGNLVTMKWWNDLWLNESFADFISYVCSSNIKKDFNFKTVDSWEDFVINKDWGYFEDQKSTTHPIYCEVESTSVADSIFDGITYSKGAAVMKQLFFRFGPELFFQRMSTYFKKYEWSNATLKDFFLELEGGEETKNPIFDMKLFENEWIRSKGLNTVSIYWEKETVNIVQENANEYCNTLRHNKIKIACYNSTGKIIQTEDIFITPLTGNSFILNDPEAVVGILPNHEDWAYIRILLDRKSTDFFLSNINKLENSIDRLVILQSLYETVLEGKLISTKFFKIASEMAEKSAENQIFFSFLIESLNNVIFNYMPEEHMLLCASELFDRLLKVFNSTENFHIQKLIIQNIICFAIEKSQIEDCITLLEKYLTDPLGLMSLSVKWRIILKLHSIKDISKEKKNNYTEILSTIDQTEMKTRFKLQIDAFESRDQDRQKLWDIYSDPQREFSYVSFKDSLQGFFNLLVPKDIKQPFFEKSFDLLSILILKDTKNNALTFLNSIQIQPEFIEYSIINFKTMLINLEMPKYFMTEIQKEIDELVKRQKGINLFLK